MAPRIEFQPPRLPEWFREARRRAKQEREKGVPSGKFDGGPKCCYIADKKHEQAIQSPTGELIENGGFKFVLCPECKTKYKVNTDESGNNSIKGLKDVDGTEPGTQIYCLKCGTKFTIPEI